MSTVLKNPCRYLIAILAVVMVFSRLLPAYADTVCENDLARIDADFEEARLSSCEIREGQVFITISPENKPVNPSPWYAFHVTPKAHGQLAVVMLYDGAKHRYRPKISTDAKHWALVPAANIKTFGEGKKVALSLDLQDKAFWVAAQELLPNSAYTQWEKQLAADQSLKLWQIGTSVEGRPIYALSSSPSARGDKKEYVLFVGRQHPPELTGAFAMLPFLETVFGDTDLAKTFRQRFSIIAVPDMNPDGVAHGNWRHNAHGVDLNRDWGPFTQPETQAIKTCLDNIDTDPAASLRLMLDFHSTHRNVFYIQSDEDVTEPPDFTHNWLEAASQRLPGYAFERAKRHQSDKKTSKNYVYGRFGVPAITYEVGDQTDRGLIRKSATIFAEEMMKTLLFRND